MKKIYFVLWTLGALASVNAQIVSIPDVNLKLLLLAANSTGQSNQIAQDETGWIKIDTNNDGEIQVSEAMQVKALFSNCCGYPFLSTSQRITSLEGIQYFQNLTNLQIVSQNISDVTVVNSLVNLKTLNLATNWIENFNLPGLINLESLNLDNNYLSIINLSNYKSLGSLALRNNNLIVLDLNNLPLLNYVEIRNNPNMTHLFFVNHVQNYPFNVNFGLNSNLRYICVDEYDITAAMNQFNVGNTASGVVFNYYCQPFYQGLGLNVVSGQMKGDVNLDGCDSNDLACSNFKLTIQDGQQTQFTYTNQEGLYHAFLTNDEYLITPSIENSAYFNVSPASFTVNFPAQASPYTHNFCITPNGVHNDLEIVLLPMNPARAGFDAKYKIVYKNNGTQLMSGSVKLSFNDSVLDYVSSSPMVTSQTVNYLYWDFANLHPFESREINVVLNLNSPMETPPLNVGSPLSYVASVILPVTDSTPYNNHSPLDQIVVNSFDPNDKTCLEGATIAPSEVGKYVHYMIRFENTGTFPAENIVVKDMIDTNKFDIASLVPMKGSHSFVTNITAGNKVEFIFENINLPFDDANNDGYVAFKIKTKPTLVEGNTFSNSASIYFDYNFPIVTNTATTTIQALSNQDFAFGNYFSLYPNPVNAMLNIETKQTIEVSSINIYNQLGQLVLVVPNVSAVDVSNLASGNYFIKVNTDKGTSNTKFIKI